MLYQGPLLLYSATAAVVAGTLLAIGSYVAGSILVVVSLVLAGARYLVIERGENETFTLW